MQRQDVIEKFARELSQSGFDSSLSRIILEQFANELHEAGNPGVLPMDYVDAGGTGAVTRMTCDSIAGGQRSTRGVPDFLTLAITWPTGVTERFRYTSELVPSPENPWPRFTPHPDDAARCYVCGHTVNNHGTSVAHCPPFNLEYARPEDAKLPTRIAALIDRVATHILDANQDPEYLPDAHLRFLGDYMLIHQLQRSSSPGVSLMNSMAMGVGGTLGSRLYGGIFASPAQRERHDDAAVEKKSRATPKKKRATGRRGRGR